MSYHHASTDHALLFIANFYSEHRQIIAYKTLDFYKSLPSRLFYEYIFQFVLGL